MIRSGSWMAAVVCIPMTVFPLCGQVKMVPQADRIAVEIDGKQYSEFFLAPGGNKPYLYPLRTASGIVVTRHYPTEEGETRDHPWHHGMFFEHGDVNGADFWDTEPASTGPHKGRIVLKKVLEAQGGSKSGTIKAAFDSFGPDGKLFMTDTRTITIYTDDPRLRIVDYEIAIVAAQKLTFGDTKEGTFGIRLATPLSEARTGRMVNAEGLETEKNVWGKRSPWVDYYGQVDGQTVGVAIMDHPSNPRHPTYWHSRAYGLFAANPFGVKDFTGDKSQDGRLTIESGQGLRFRYRVVIHTGDVRSADIAALWARYAAGE